MKLILALILILTITFNYVNSFQYVAQKSLRNDGSTSQSCFTDGVIDLSGYTSDYSIVSFDAAVPGKGGAPVEESFAEDGYLNIDFENNRMFTKYRVELSTGINEGMIIAFGANSTEYVLPYVNGAFGSCYVGKLSFDIPQSTKVVYQGDFTLGTYAVEAFNVLSESFNGTAQSAIVGKSDCSLTSTVEYNTNENQVGRSINNFFGFVPSSNPQEFFLPAACANPTPIPSNNNKLLQKLNIHIPSSLKNRLI